MNIVANQNKILDETQIAEIASKSASELDALDIGVVKMDDKGTVLEYNKYESELGNVPQANALGKCFFTEVAPCTNNRLFYGKFQEGVAKNELDSAMPYVFTYKIRPTAVIIQMYRNTATGENWLFVKRK